ncbi:putative minor capsid protein [Eel River basin pequenovirus]|nr:putative minor capsid protein [Eel River basin pequenovirus]
MQVNVAMIRAAMNLIAEGHANSDLIAANVTPANYRVFTGDQFWTGAERGVVTKVMEGLCYGVCDIQQIPRFELPAEYMAAVIRTFVSPCNYHSACHWMSRTKSASVEGIDGTENVTPGELYAALLQLASADEENPESFRHKFEKRMAAKFRTAQEEPA